jgi:hypothetical protein
MSHSVSDTLSCWQCGNTLKNVIFPVSRREECPLCNADQHVCKMCKEFDGRNSCSETRAEDVTDREKANFCDYFSPSGKVFAIASRQKERDAKVQLAALFGEEAEPNADTERLNQKESLTPAEMAERKLREMLGD